MTKLPKKQGRPCKGRIDSNDELPLLKKRHCGHPCKDKENQPPKAFNVSAIVEVARPPLHVKGKTPKGHKWVKQEPIQLGPFQFNERTSYSEFLGLVHKAVYISEDQMVLNNMTWCTNKSANSAMPLTDSGGYWTMVQQILAMKDPLSAVLIVGHLVPKTNVLDAEVPVSVFIIMRLVIN